jgi:hypothetical protein
MSLTLEINQQSVDVPRKSLILSKNFNFSVKHLNALIATDLYSVPSDQPIEAEYFSLPTDAVKPLRSCVNFLYIYPQQLNYGSQKHFSRARNIAVSVSLIRFKEGHSSVEKCFIDLANLKGPLVESVNCALQYHEQNPVFSDEFKLQLPLDLVEGDHLLFKFSHISLSNAQKAQSNEAVEQNVGYSWVPLINENSLFMNQDVQEFDLPVAVALTPDYFTYDPTNGHSKKVRIIKIGTIVIKFRAAIQHH